MDRWVTPPKRVTSPTLGPPLPCKQALKNNQDLMNLGKLRNATPRKLTYRKKTYMEKG